MNDSIPLLGFTTSLLELLSFLLSVITVALTIRQIHWGWLFSILSSALYAAVFFNAKLYGDMGLQVVFILVSLWGWWVWLRGEGGQDALPVTRLSSSQKVLAVCSWLVMCALLVWFLKTYTDTDVPYADGFLTAASLLGQFLLSRKKIENWMVWIMVDVLYVGLYVVKNLQLTALLYAVFVVLAVMGLRSWGKTCQQ
ncbi:nicotinamide riboside transporter PnuC [Undibacterium sp. SXout20W]|uniref:nicotinamide riboside transporter PnuC n=1 Tax=Undibacterium sp. SXout20W TaxID=3413051 RepID=UPI003BF13A4A